MQSDLSTLGKNLESLANESQLYSMKMKNRENLQQQIGEFMNEIAISEQLIQDIFSKEIDEHYYSLLKSIENSENYILGKGNDDVPICKEIQLVIKKLRLKAALRIREFLMLKINTLTKPNTNIQIIQQNILVKYTPLFGFLCKHHPEFAQDVHKHYVETIGPIIDYYLKAYVTTLLPLKFDVGEKYDLLGVTDPYYHNRIVNLFSLGDRLKFINDPEIVITHIALTEGKKLPFPKIFGSWHQLLVSTVVSEIRFQEEFFLSKYDYIETLFKESTTFYLDTVKGYVPTCFDSVGLLVMLGILETQQSAFNAYQQQASSTRESRISKKFIDPIRTTSPLRSRNPSSPTLSPRLRSPRSTSPPNSPRSTSPIPNGSPPSSPKKSEVNIDFDLDIAELKSSEASRSSLDQYWAKAKLILKSRVSILLDMNYQSFTALKSTDIGPFGTHPLIITKKFGEFLGSVNALNPFLGPVLQLFLHNKVKPFKTFYIQLLSNWAQNATVMNGNTTQKHVALINNYDFIARLVRVT
eukprot:TRINITY_DN18784_c0_g1_i5.p1 TRINITY_DN18784_c0_g1~~TRINITY_DN18784_c0_g1_i5.p1  ORF type:complete len:525 (+),score=75.28 TRINITY_DN18784_c0_g1_i5:314-1888(+)